MKTRNRIRRSSQRRGALTVEFAICCSLFFMVTFAGFEFTRFLFVRHAVDQASYEAARVGIVPGNTVAQVRSKAESMLAAAGVRKATITITPAVITTTTETVRVAVTCSFTDNSWVPPTFMKSTTIGSTITLDHENKAYLANSNANFGNNSGAPKDI